MTLERVAQADMATVGRWLADGFSWWRAELAGMMPERLRRQGRAPRRAAIYDRHGLSFVEEDRPLAWTPPARPRPVELAVAQSHAMTRMLDLPAVGVADARRMVGLEGDRLFPLPRHLLLLDTEVTAADGRAQVAVAALPRGVAEAALAAAAAAGVRPTRLGIAATADSRTVRFDFVPQLRAEGRMPPRGSGPAVWWSLVVTGLLLNLAILIARDRQDVDYLAGLVDAQAPAMAVGGKMVRRIGLTGEAARRTLARRRQHDPIGDLAVVTAALDDRAWVQRLTWNGAGIRVAGYKQPSADVLAALRRVPRFVNVRMSTTDVTAELPIGQPFDVSADRTRALP